MALTLAVRQALRAEYGSLLSERRDAFDLTKAELDAAIAAIDDWIEANAASFNAAIPLPARTELTVAQKAELFFFVARRRFGG